MKVLDKLSESTIKSIMRWNFTDKMSNGGVLMLLILFWRSERQVKCWSEGRRFSGLSLARRSDTKTKKNCASNCTLVYPQESHTEYLPRTKKKMPFVIIFFDGSGVTGCEIIPSGSNFVRKTFTKYCTETRHDSISK